MGEPEQQITSRLLLYQLQSYQRQEAIIGILMMCLSTLSAQFLIQNIYPCQQWEESGGTAEFLSCLVVAFETVLWVTGLIIYFQGFENKGKRDIAARNKGLIYGLGAVNISLVIIIIWPGINERISFAIKVLPAYIGIVIGNL
jgi:hypothetical protein